MQCGPDPRVVVVFASPVAVLGADNFKCAEDAFTELVGGAGDTLVQESITVGRERLKTFPQLRHARLLGCANAGRILRIPFGEPAKLWR